VRARHVIGQAFRWIVPIDFKKSIREYRLLFMAFAFKKVTAYTKYVILSQIVAGELPLSLLVRMEIVYKNNNL
jgi:hypothetical protein